jgi:hypothetical protein
MNIGYWFINTAGIGGLLVITVATIVLIAYARMLYWIYQGGKVEGDPDARH